MGDVLKELLEKNAITSGGTLSGGGRLNPDQTEKFIQDMVDQTKILGMVTTRKMKSSTAIIDTLGLDNRVIRKGTEGTNPSNITGVTTGRRELKSVETLLAADLSYSFLEDNIEGEKAEDTLVAMFAKQYGNDIVDLGFNGDEAAPAGTHQDFLSINDGWVKIGKNEGHFVNSAGFDFTSVGKTTIDFLKSLLGTLPDKHKRDVAELKYFVAPSIIELYVDELSKRQTALGDLALTKANGVQYKGIDLIPNFALDQKTVVLANPKNLNYGVQRDISIAFFNNVRRRMVEYTITARTDFELAVPDAVVVAQG